MKVIRTLALFLLTVDVAFGQLTLDQKLADFNQVATLYSKRYGPYEWKRDVLGYDLLNAAPWIDKISKSKDDLEFYEVLSEYVSRLNDAHDGYSVPSNFLATLNFSVDIYDGKLLVDSINRARLPVANFPFSAGYELVSIDDQDAMTLLQTLLRYEVAANPRSTSRLAASLLTTRPQQVMPHAPNVPETSTVVFRRPDSKTEIYAIPWTKSGLPLTVVGRYPTPAALMQAAEEPADEIPAYMAPLIRLQNSRIPDRAVIGFGSVTPVFIASLPSGFTRRLGATPGDPFFSGVFEASGFKIGFIRIPSYSPAIGATAALAAFQREMAYFQANTDGLVIDDMRNPGGSGSYVNQILSYVMPSQWRAIGFEIRATSDWIASISSAVEQAKATRAPQNVIDLLESIKAAIVNANATYRGRTDAIPLDDVGLDRQPARDAQGNLLAYTKPLIVLIDEMSASAAEVFAAGIQDNARGPLVGWRTMGAGGNVEAWEAGSYSLGSATVTESLMNRGRQIFTTGYPATLFLSSPYVENVGVLPDVPIDFMTAANLSQAGKPFVDAFVTAIVNEIRKSR